MSTGLVFEARSAKRLPTLPSLFNRTPRLGHFSAARDRVARDPARRHASGDAGEAQQRFAMSSASASARNTRRCRSEAFNPSRSGGGHHQKAYRRLPSKLAADSLIRRRGSLSGCCIGGRGARCQVATSGVFSLTGGGSTRMGRDKAAIEIDGVTLAERTAKQLAARRDHASRSRSAPGVSIARFDPRGSCQERRAARGNSRGASVRSSRARALTERCRASSSSCRPAVAERQRQAAGGLAGRRSGDALESSR